MVLSDRQWNAKNALLPTKRLKYKKYIYLYTIRQKYKRTKNGVE